MYREQINKLDKQGLIALIDNEGLTNLIEIDHTTTEEDTRELLIDTLEGHGDWIENEYEDTLDSIQNGNWNEGAEIMNKHFISIFNLIDWIEDYNEEMGYSVYSWFDLSSVASLMETLATLRREA